MPDDRYGYSLPVSAVLHAPHAMGAAISRGHLFVVGEGAIRAVDIADPLHPRVVGEASFHGVGRQVAVRGDIACVTARIDGLYVFDVADPADIRLLAHHDSIELATGVDIHGDLLFIAQRHYGVEIVDISDPAHPAFVGKIRTSEAQSIAARGNLLYVGDWHSSQVTTIDIANPRRPRILSHTDLDGYGDGVDIQGEFLYASTGHHSRRNRTGNTPGQPGFGEGHGLEILSLADAAHPRVVSRVKFPPGYMRDGFDMWSPVASGNHVFCADTFNGTFVVDVSAPETPEIVAHHDELVAGLAVGDGCIYAACPRKGLVVLEAPEMARIPPADKGDVITIPPQTPREDAHCRSWRPGGQVHAVSFLDDLAVVAAGTRGVRVARIRPDIEEIAHIDTPDIAYHVETQDDRVYLSQGTHGIAIWQHLGSGDFEQIGLYEDPEKRSIRHALLSGQDRYAIAEVGSSYCVIDVSDPASPRAVAEHPVPLIYGDQTGRGLIRGRYTCVAAHTAPVRWVDLKAPDPAHTITDMDFGCPLGAALGAVALGERLLITARGGYRLVEPLDPSVLDAPLIPIETDIQGKPHIAGNLLFLVSRSASRIAVFDISDPEKPRLLREFETDGNPGAIAMHRDALVIPDGVNGLLIYDRFLKDG